MASLTDPARQSLDTLTAGGSDKPATERVSLDDHNPSLPVTLPRFGPDNELERYQDMRVIGAGGMGEIHLCRDQRVGRDVALKILRQEARGSTLNQSRFLREARVQGQLEHPAVVPVYDLGQATDGALYFTMKRVRGMTLAEVLAGLKARDATVQARYNRRRLLTALANVCLALDFAHTRGVLHRDIKPQNIMLGDFGEVHLLDWGLAKVAGVADLPAGEGIDLGQQLPDTAHGEVMGTPGYMAPEQIRGHVELIGAASDVYPLGVILFELLTLERFHRGNDSVSLMESTLVGTETRAALRAPEADVPPELEAIWQKATQLDPGKRFASARELSDAIERYLDGDRDFERRQVLAAEHAQRAANTARYDDRTSRGQAMREAARALALDPTQPEALEVMSRLLVTPPGDAPPEVETELAGMSNRARRRATLMGVVAYSVWFAFAPWVLGMGIKSWTAAAITLALMAGSLAMSLWMFRTGHTENRYGLVLMVVSCAAIASFSGLFGPFLLVPPLALVTIMVMTMMAEKGRIRNLVLCTGILTTTLPFVLDLSGLVAPGFSVSADEIVIHARTIHFPATHAKAFLLVASVILVVIPGLLIAPMRDALREAERRLLIHAWHLQQLIPDAKDLPRPVELDVAPTGRS